MTSLRPVPSDQPINDRVDVGVLSAWCDLAHSWPLPGLGDTNRRFERLSSVAETDLVLGRLVEAHADAIAITTELGCDLVQAGRQWGVWAAGPADSVSASQTIDGWLIDGRKAWCSGATLLTHALVDASTGSGQQLFAVALDSPTVVLCPPSWVGPGMRRADTRTVAFEKAPAVPVGRPGEYLARPGFWAGAVGVAACWHGGTVAVGRPLLQRSRTSPDPHLLAHLGAVHVALEENRAVLRRAAHQLDTNPRSYHGLAARSVRSTIERNAAEVVDRVGRALGPGPLAHDAAHAGLVADLTVYVRQHHAERDLEQIGRDLSERDDPWPS
jgi:alkylation response protein AidB-like acyl-CoA dehydrogenase